MDQVVPWQPLLDLISDNIPDETTILSFRHLLEKHELGEQIFETVKPMAYEESDRFFFGKTQPRLPNGSMDANDVSLRCSNDSTSDALIRSSLLLCPLGCRNRILSQHRLIL